MKLLFMLFNFGCVCSYVLYLMDGTVLFCFFSNMLWNVFITVRNSRGILNITIMFKYKKVLHSSELLCFKEVQFFTALILGLHCVACFVDVDCILFSGSAVGMILYQMEFHSCFFFLSKMSCDIL